MGYRGQVQVGGPPDVRELAGLTVSKLAVGPYDNNAYLLRCPATGEALLVDAAAEPERLLSLVGDAPLARIVTTHRHPDHWQALARVREATGARLVAHPDDAPGLPLPVDEPVHVGDVVRVGQAELTVVHLRGHTPGSVALLYDPEGTAGDPAAGSPHLFTGDSLFPGGPGKTTSPADFTSLMDDLERAVFGVLPDETWVYPGHGADTTLGAERPALPDWRARGW